MSKTEAKELPPLEYLHKMFIYNDLTGAIYRRNDGTRADISHSGGYKVVKILGKYRLGHRIAFKMFYGREPGPLLDHKNRNRADNSIRNLRESNKKENARNTQACDDTYLKKLESIAKCWEDGYLSAKNSDSVRQFKSKSHSGYDKGFREILGKFENSKQRRTAMAKKGFLEKIKKDGYRPFKRDAPSFTVSAIQENSKYYDADFKEEVLKYKTGKRLKS